MRWVRAGALRAVLLGVLWVLLSSAAPEYAVYGLVSVSAATALSLWLLPAPGPDRPRSPRAGLARRLRGGAGLVGWFLGQSVVGGVDVARRALRRTPDIAPEVLPARIDLPPGGARHLAVLLMNLMPGSMVQRAGEDVVELHTLAAELEPVAQWQRLQRRVAAAAGLPQPDTGGDEDQADEDDEDDDGRP